MWGKILTGALGIGGDMLTNRANRKNAQSANKFASAEALKNRNFQERMSNTSHQREIKDLKAAGLNPILSGMGGGGSSTPSGSAASAHQAQSKIDVNSATSAAQSRSLFNLQSDQLEAQIANIKSQTNKTNIDSQLGQQSFDVKSVKNQPIHSAKTFTEWYKDTLAPALSNYGQSMSHHANRDKNKIQFKGSKILKQLSKKGKSAVKKGFHLIHPKPKKKR